MISFIFPQQSYASYWHYVQSLVQCSGYSVCVRCNPLLSWGNRIIACPYAFHAYGRWSCQLSLPHRLSHSQEAWAWESTGIWLATSEQMILSRSSLIKVHKDTETCGEDWQQTLEYRTQPPFHSLPGHMGNIIFCYLQQQWINSAGLARSTNMGNES